MPQNKRGFTLIELTIVLAVIAVLAVGIIAALNPGEQSKRANDARIKHTMGEFMNATQAWDISNGYSPFCSSTLCSGQRGPDLLTNAGDDLSARVISKLVAQNELTSNFDIQTAADQSKIASTFIASTNQLTFCYKLTSASERNSISGNVWCDGSTGPSNYGFCQLRLSDSDNKHFCIRK